MVNMTIIERITELYLVELPKCQIMLSKEEATEYFERLLMNGNIITYVENGELCGFLEFWKITPEIFGKVCLGLPISHDTDLLNGEVCLISRMWIDPSERSGHTFYHLASQFLKANKQATHYVALQWQKKHKPIQIYTHDEIFKHYRMEK